MSLMLVLAGCAGLGGGDGATPESNETAGDGLDNETDNESDDGATNESSGDADAAASGSILLAVDGVDTHPEAESADDESSANASFWLGGDGEHTWHAGDASVTLDGALGQLDIDAEADSLTYDGTTYEDGDETTVSYRVNGESVDPAEYELEDGDAVFVTVHTENTETPGAYFEESHPHPHGTLELTVDDTTVDFSEEKYTHADDYFHFHSGEEPGRWHGHSINVTIEYALSTLPGIEVTEDSITYDNTTYEAGDDAEIDVTVNGESVDPTTYILKDGDAVEIVVEEDE